MITLFRRSGKPLTARVEMAVQAFLVPKRATASDLELALLQSAQAHCLSDDELDIAAWRWAPPRNNGSRVTVLLVHGWSSRGSHMGAFVAPLLRAGMEVWTFDAHAHGDSAGTYSSVAHHARSVQLVASAMGRTDGIIAHSVGSPAALMACALGLSPRVSVHLAGPSSLRRVAVAAGLLVGLNDAEIPDYLNAIERVAGLPLHEAAPPALTARLAHRGLLLHDPADREVPYAESLELSRHWVQAELRPLKNLGHRRLLQDPGVVDESVAFLLSEIGNVSTRGGAEA